jgi:hypothetical protein
MLSSSNSSHIYYQTEAQNISAGSSSCCVKESRIYPHSFLNSILCDGEWSASRPDRFIPKVNRAVSQHVYFEQEIFPSRESDQIRRSSIFYPNQYVYWAVLIPKVRVSFRCLLLYYCKSLWGTTDNYLSLPKSVQDCPPTRNAFVNDEELNSTFVGYTEWHNARKKFGENRSNYWEAENVNLPSKRICKFTRTFEAPLYLLSRIQRTESRWTHHKVWISRICLKLSELFKFSLT